MKDSAFPTSGGRVVLVFARATAETVSYEAELYVPDARFTSAAEVRVADGDVVFPAWAPESPPAWLLAFARAFLRSAWLARRDDPDEPWPARINRWRPAK